MSESTAATALRGVAGIIFDLDGTLIQAGRALPGARETIDWMSERAMPFVVCTQDTEHGAEAIARRLQTMELAIEPREVVTCGTVVLDHLATRHRDAPVCAIAGAGQEAYLRDRGVRLTRDAEAARVLLVERYGGFSAEDFDAGCRAVWAGAAFLAMARDRAFRASDGLIPGTGATVRAIEHATRRRARVLGKPSRDIAALALRTLGLPAEQVLVVGDNLDADVALGKVAGCRTALTLAGVTTMDGARRAPARLRPDVIVPEMAALLSALRAQSRA